VLCLLFSKSKHKSQNIDFLFIYWGGFTTGKMSTENNGGIQYEMKDLEKMKRICLCNLVLRMQDEMQ